MNSVLLRISTRYLVPVVLVVSVIMLLRGHNAPGGGFIGGLVAAAAVTLYVFSMDVAAARRVLGTLPQKVLAVGLAIATLSAVPSAFLGEAFFTGLWASLELPGYGYGIRYEHGMFTQRIPKSAAMAL